jgi:hypothetical protein
LFCDKIFSGCWSEFESLRLDSSSIQRRQDIGQQQYRPA